MAISPRKMSPEHILMWLRWYGIRRGGQFGVQVGRWFCAWRECECECADRTCTCLE